jgi:DNA-binding transcriptional ArsR family regulator
MTNDSAVAAAFAALADPTRRLVFERLAHRSRSVAEVADGLPVSRPAVSQHLKVLKAAGLVRDEPDGARRVYRIDPRGLEMMRGYLDRFWDRALAAFKAAAEGRKEDARKDKEDDR